MSLETDLSLKREYGPFRGFVDAVPRHLVPLDAITGDSIDVLVDSNTGRLVRRGGTSRVGAATGLLEMSTSVADMRGQQGWELASPSLSDGYPTHAVLFADEARGYGQVYVRDTDGPTDYVLGEEFGSTHYPTAASTVGNLKIVPIPYDGGGATGYTRFVSEYDRRRPMAGSRTRVGVTQHELFPGYDAVPTVWDRRFNRSSGSGTQKVHIRPAGHVPPLHPGSFPAASYPARTTAKRSWAEGDTFFYTVVFKHKDGTYSMPCIPRDRNATYAAGYGLCIVNDDADGTAEYFESIPWRYIPVGDDSVAGRVLCRSQKKTAAQVTAGEWPKPGTLYVCGYIEDNVTTSYDLADGDDGSLIDDPAVINFLHRWPERAKQAWAFDQRIGFGDLRANPCALCIAPTGSATSYDLNAGDDSVLIHGSQGFLLRVTKSTVGGMALELRTVAIAGAPTTTTITLSSTKTLEALVDEINATVVGGAGREWRAQVVPGMNRNTPSDQLAPTSQQVSNCAGASGSTTVTSTTTDAFKDVAEGHRIRGHANIPAGAYVTAVDRTTNKSLTISTATTGAVPAATTLTFHVDVGDDSLATDSTYGNMRAYGQSFPLVLALKQSWMDTFPAEPGAFGFTAGGPTNAPNGAESWVTSVANRKNPPLDVGVFMGGAPLLDGCVVFYSKAIGILRNRRAGGTGEDADYRLEVVWKDGGCISWQSIFAANGVVGCLRPTGMWATDGEREAFLSTDLYNPAGGGTGCLANEVALCSAEALRNGSDYGCRAMVTRGRLWVAWRTSVAAGTVADRVSCYDFSPSVEATGLAQLLRPDGSPYGWSAPLTYSAVSYGAGARAGCLFAVQKAGGLQLYTCDDTNDGTTCGLVARFEDGTFLDGSNPIGESFWLRLDDWEVDGKKAAHQARVDYLLSGGTNDFATLSLYLNQLRTGAQTRTLARTTTGTQMTEKKLELPQSARGSATHHEINVAGDTASATRTATEYYRLQLLGEACDDES